MDVTKTPQTDRVNTTRFTVPPLDSARMERRRNTRLRTLMDQLERANANGNDDIQNQTGMITSTPHARLAKEDMILLQGVNDDPTTDDRRKNTRTNAAHAGDDLPLFNPLKKDISI